MEHKEYIHIQKNATTAILFIHGIVGTPNHFRDFISLIPTTFSVYNVLLDGHGKAVKDFSKTSMKTWETQIASVVAKLSATHQRIYIVAHSLGSLLAIEQAIKNEAVCKLFLLAVPLRLAIKPKVPINSLKVYFDKINPYDFEALAAKKCYGIDNDKNIFHYIGWIPRFLELFSKIRRTRKIINMLNTPCMVYQSQKDEMVSQKSAKYLKQNSCVTIQTLKYSGHYYYDKLDWAFLMNEFTKIINEELN